MDIAAAERAVHAAMPSILRVCITGGEPLLHPHVEQILDWPSRYPDRGFVLSTNATGSVELLQQVQDHPWLVAVSLHGPREPHNRYTCSDLFDRVTDAILRLTQTNVVHLYCVLNDCLNEEDIDWLFRFRNDAGVAFLRFIVPRTYGRCRPLTRLGLIEATRARLDRHSGLKITSSLTDFLSVDFDRRRTS
jgi:molybdenum cofactor biosynthesis enzyme MoaA